LPAYCYASAGDTPQKSMPLAVANKGIDYVAANAKRKGQRHFEVIFHGGGEPTVSWSVMSGAFAHAKRVADELGLEVRGTAATNGVLSNDQLEWIVGNLAGVSLSFDGLPAVHDRHRLTMFGKPSSHRVLGTMRRFDEVGFRYGVRVTVTADAIAQLPASVRFLLERHRPARVQVEPAYPLGRWRGAPSAETTAFIDAFREAQKIATALGREIVFSAARAGLITNHFCGVTQDTFALSPDGNVSACYEVFAEDDPRADVFFYGRATDAGYAFDRQILDRLRRQSAEHRSYCDGCFARWSCAGDCLHRVLAAGADGGDPGGSDRCHITRELTKDQLLARIAASGGVAWHDLPRAATPSCGKEVL
jgi:uncharacterized protein